MWTQWKQTITLIVALISYGLILYVVIITTLYDLSNLPVCLVTWIFLFVCTSRLLCVWPRLLTCYHVTDLVSWESWCQSSQLYLRRWNRWSRTADCVINPLVLQMQSSVRFRKGLTDDDDPADDGDEVTGYFSTLRDWTDEAGEPNASLIPGRCNHQWDKETVDRWWQPSRWW